MNDYDDSEDYAAGAFRARSNTWPLPRPDFSVTGGVSIDETLPELELEDDLFTTNDNWASGLVEHDIMSWDPILNAQNQHQHQSNNQVATIHHQGQQPQPQPQPQTQHQHQQLSHHQQTQHLRQGELIHHQPQQLHQQHPQNKLHQSQQPHLQDSIHGGSFSMLKAQIQSQQPQLSHHQTLNDAQHCLDPDDYHVQKLHQLHLDNNQASDNSSYHQLSPLSSITCLQGSTQQCLTSEGFELASDALHQGQHHHQHQNNLHHLHHVQHLVSAGGYDPDQQISNPDLHNHVDDNPHQLHQLTSSILGHHSTSPQILSSSLSTSGIGLSGDLEDLDYKSVDPSAILHHADFDDQHVQLQSAEPRVIGNIGGEGESAICSAGNNASGGANKQSNSTTGSKTKLNTPRRNAWGNMSYADLISQAINSTNDKRLTLSQIYDWMVQHVPYFKDKGDSNSSAGWKNSVRHNLSLHSRFKRLQNEGTGKSSWWTINPEVNVNKCARRRAASMEASKYEKKRGRAKKRADAIRQGLISYPSLTNSSLNGSISALEQQLHHVSSQFVDHNLAVQPTDGQDSNIVNNTNQNSNNHQISDVVLSESPADTIQSQEHIETNNIGQQPQQQRQNQKQSQKPKSPANFIPSSHGGEKPNPSHQDPSIKPEVLTTQLEPPPVHHNLSVSPSSTPLSGTIHQNIIQKLESFDNDSYYIQNTSQQHHLSHQQQQQLSEISYQQHIDQDLYLSHPSHQMMNSHGDHMESFGGRHALYMHDPCNDCNCTDMINCNENATMSFS